MLRLLPQSEKEVRAVLYSRLERVSRKDIKRGIEEYCREAGITGIEDIDINGHGLAEIIEEITNRLVSEVAKEEKESFKSAQKRGIEEARERGVVLGRPRKEMPPEFEKLYKAYREGTITAGECAKILEIQPSAFSYMIKKYEKKSAL